MCSLALPLGRQRRRDNIGQGTVHVPLDIVDLTACKVAVQYIQQIFPHFSVSKVKQILVATLNRRVSGNVHNPVRMGAVELTVGADGFGFKPQAEL